MAHQTFVLLYQGPKTINMNHHMLMVFTKLLCMGWVQLTQSN